MLISGVCFLTRLLIPSALAPALTPPPRRTAPFLSLRTGTDSSGSFTVLRSEGIPEAVRTVQATASLLLELAVPTQLRRSAMPAVRPITSKLLLALPLLQGPETPSPLVWPIQPTTSSPHPPPQAHDTRSRQGPSASRRWAPS